MGILDVPERLDNSVNKWISMLRLGEWKIRTRMALTVNSSEYTLACAQVSPNINHATLTFRPDFDDDDQEWQRTVIHELLHVSHGRIDQFVECVLLQCLPEGERKLALLAYTQLIEPYTDAMAKALWEIDQSKEESPVLMLSGPTVEIELEDKEDENE